MKINIDIKKCLGCGMCVSLYPKVFELGEDGYAVVKKGVSVDEKKSKQLIIFCPAQAISNEK